MSASYMYARRSSRPARGEWIEMQTSVNNLFMDVSSRSTWGESFCQKLDDTLTFFERETIMIDGVVLFFFFILRYNYLIKAAPLFRIPSLEKVGNRKAALSSWS